MVNIGSIIRDHLRKKGSSVKQLAKEMKLSHSQLYYNLNHNHFTIDRLEQISRTLDHDFFAYLTESKGSTEEEAVKLRTEIKELNSKVAILQKEVELLREINALLKAKNP